MQAITARLCVCSSSSATTDVSASPPGRPRAGILPHRQRDYDRRPDLLLHRTHALRRPPPKGQELEDHYFGSIKQRVAAFMKTSTKNSGSSASSPRPSTTKSRPAQHELAPIFTTDQHRDRPQPADHGTHAKRRQLRHGLVCLLHEKPFAGVNGSGKHNNWSISTDTGVNLLEPGKRHMRTPSSFSSSAPSSRPWTNIRICFAFGRQRRQRPPPGRQRGPAGHRLHLPRRLELSYRTVRCPQGLLRKGDSFPLRNHGRAVRQDA
jgi:hypothetical protein